VGSKRGLWGYADLLFLVQGNGQPGLAKNWGDGLATDPVLVSGLGLSDPNPFFQALLQKPYLEQVVMAPHVYPPSVTKAWSATAVGAPSQDSPCSRSESLRFGRPSASAAAVAASCVVLCGAMSAPAWPSFLGFFRLLKVAPGRRGRKSVVISGERGCGMLLEPLHRFLLSDPSKCPWNFILLLLFLFSMPVFLFTNCTSTSTAKVLFSFGKARRAWPTYSEMYTHVSYQTVQNSRPRGGTHASAGGEGGRSVTRWPLGAVQGPPLYQRLSQSFGYLNKQGYCTSSNTVGAPSGTCHIFPIILGEMGSGFVVRKYLIIPPPLALSHLFWGPTRNLLPCLRVLSLAWSLQKSWPHSGRSGFSHTASSAGRGSPGHCFRLIGS
jgi:hypothetical protein